MASDEKELRSWFAAAIDASRALQEHNNAREWLVRARAAGEPVAPLAAEVWVFDQDLARVLLVRHRWRAWVPPGGKVEPGETPREAAARELFEETGLRIGLHSVPAAVAIRTYGQHWSPTLGLSYAAVADVATPLVPENGQPVAWTHMDRRWESYFPDDQSRICRHAARLAQIRTARP